MKILIPMAGYGTRLRPHTYSRPKPLINVAGQPMLKHLIDSLQVLDIDEYIFIVGYLGEQLESYVRETYQFRSIFIEQTELNGQSPAVYLAREYLEGPTMILFADTLFQTDLEVINRTDADGVIFVKEVEDPRRFGVVTLNDQRYISRFVEKPSTMENRQAVIGLYWVRDAALLLDAIETQMSENRQTKNEFYIADAFQIMIEQGAKFKTQDVTVWLDTGKPETVLETNQYLLDHGRDNSREAQNDNVMIVPPVYIHPSAKIDHAVIGPHATIAAECEIRYSIIRNSIIDEGAKVANAILDQSLIGQKAEVTGHYSTLNVGDQSSIHFA